MIDFIVNVWLFIQSHSQWYSASYFIILTGQLIVLIGWFFSTDYADEMIQSIEHSERGGFGLFMLLIAITGAACNGVLGTASAWSIVFNTFMWVFFVGPVAVAILMDYRKKIRSKRGKD